MIVSELGLSPTALQDEIAIVTGAGGGIGYEAVRSLPALAGHQRHHRGNIQNRRRATRSPPDG